VMQVRCNVEERSPKLEWQTLILQHKNKTNKQNQVTRK
jgi:hypothetical protein